MTRAGVSAVVAIALAAALALRLARLDVRPMHHDEANQAVKFGTLLEHGEYRYDARDHHGPTLYYLSLPAAWLRGQFTLASLDEHTLRGVTAVFGTATILLLPLLSDGIGRTAVATGAILMALSPAMVFYSRMFIQESLFTCFALAFVIAIGRVTLGGGLAWSAVAGLAAGLAVATKETSAIVLPAALLACTMAWWSLGAGRPRHPFANGRWRAAAVVGLTVAAATAALFYSSFFSSPGGVLEPFRGAGTYLGRGLAPADHAHAWHYYFRPARVFLVGWPAVERGTGPRAGVRRRSGGRARRQRASGPHLLGALSRRLRRHRRGPSSRPSPTRLPGICCRSTRACSCSRGSDSRNSSTQPGRVRSAAHWSGRSHWRPQTSDCRPGAHR